MTTQTLTQSEIDLRTVRETLNLTPSADDALAALERIEKSLPTRRSWRCRIGLHHFSGGRAVGEYDSITGPRTIVLGHCECGKPHRWTVRGSI